MSLNYVPLHCHSDASLDGAGTVQTLVAEAKRLGMVALALTDHGTLANAVSFSTTCEEYGIKPILGCECYLLYNGKRHHLTLLSASERGFNNLVALDSWSHAEHYIGGYPLITLDALETHSYNLIALSGCASSALFEGEMSDAYRYIADLRSAIGPENLYLETMFVGSHNTWERPLQIAKNLDIPFVVTNDTHYPCQNQFHAHQTITSARRGFTYDSQELWLKSGDEIRYTGMHFVDYILVEHGLRESLAIAERCEAWSMKAPPSLPTIKDSAKHLEAALLRALKIDVEAKGQQKVRLARLRYEFKILNERGFLDYIYILWDIVLWAKNGGIYVGPGRGSGGGSYVLYLLGITAIDPIEYGLVFERFLNPSRSDYPDVDVDFESDRREEVLNYASNRWGTIPIATYSCYSHKSAVHDIARVLSIPKDLELPAAEGASDGEEFTEFINSHPAALSAYQTMLGQIRHRGKHAAGVIIPNRPVPIERAGDHLVAAWAEGMNTKDLSKVGIVKYDLLSLTALSQLRLMAEMTGEPSTSPSEFWSYKNSEVYDLFCQGDVSGIFQWTGSEGIRDLTVSIQPRNFYDLTTCNALYRPGALDAKTAEHYPEFMVSPRKLHPRIDPHLEKTYGVICYQEQVMAVVAEVMNGDLGQADLARRLISKAAEGDPKWEREIDVLRANFADKGVENGFSPELIGKLWKEVYTHSRYSYNLAHASAYTMISYQMAWYKVYHRAAFTVAMLQYDTANAQTYILDAVEHGLRIYTPHVNYSDAVKFTKMGESIYLPLNNVAFVGDKAAATIYEEGKKVLGFNFYEEFGKVVPKKICNNRSKGMLERIGSFAGLEGDPASIIDNYIDLPCKGKYETQLEILGYIVPTKEMVEKIKALRALPASKGYLRFAGFIKEVKKKTSAHGDYWVYNLSPEGSFWSRIERPKFTVGKLVSGTKSRFGHSNDATIFRLEE